MFSGQGAQYVNMGSELYQVESTFREQVDTCAEILRPHLGLDLRRVLYPNEAQAGEAAARLKQTASAQPALFVIEYSLARLWMAWGVQPQAMVGHSIGEYVAACLAGVLSLEDALALVAARGRLMQQLPRGAMLAVPLSEVEVQPCLGSDLSLAAINSPDLCVVSGRDDAVTELQSRLAARGVECRRLETSHAFHSGMMDPILQPFTEQVRKVKLNPPQINYLSNLTGTGSRLPRRPIPITGAGMFATRCVLPKVYKPSSKNPDKFYWKSVPAGPWPRRSCGTATSRPRRLFSRRCVILGIFSRTWNFCLRPWASCGWVGRPWTGRDSTSMNAGIASPCQLIRLSASDTGSNRRNRQTIERPFREHHLDRLCRARRRE